MKEIKVLQTEATTKMKAMRSNVNKTEEMKRVEILSQHMQIWDDPALLKQKVHSNLVNDSLTPVIGTLSKKTPKVMLMLSNTSNDLSNSNENFNNKALKSARASSKLLEFSGEQFFDMDDKEFGNIVQRISKLAAKRAR